MIGAQRHAQCRIGIIARNGFCFFLALVFSSAVLTTTTVPTDATAFHRELVTHGLRRTRVVAWTLVGLEAGLFAVDAVGRGSQDSLTASVLVWRSVALVFLLGHLAMARWPRYAAWSLRYFLAGGMGLCVWITALLAPTAGDLSTFTIGALGVAAACPLPGRFVPSLFFGASAGLGAWLAWAVPETSAYSYSNLMATCVMGVAVERFSYQAAWRSFQHRQEVETQRARADALLLSVFPATVADGLKRGQRSIALHAEVTVLFADVVGFTALSSRLLPSHLLEVLEEIFARFDALAEQNGVVKVKTIGDAYMAVTNAPEVINEPVSRMARFALGAVGACQALAQQHGLDLRLRVGLHTGPVVAGVIGQTRLGYDLWGETVNLAQRIATQAAPDEVLVSEPVFYRLRESAQLQSRGTPDLKGVGPTPVYALLGMADTERGI